MGKSWCFHFACRNSHNFCNVFLFFQTWGKVCPVSDVLGVFPLQHSGTARAFLQQWQQLGLGGNIPADLPGGEEQGEGAEEKAYKYCMAAALLLPEPSYHCYSALCKNVTSLHCSALRRVEIKLCRLFGAAWSHPGILEMDLIRKMACVTVLSAFPPFLIHLLPLSNGSGIYCSISAKVFKGSEIPEGVTFLQTCWKWVLRCRRDPQWSSYRGKSPLSVMVGVFPGGWACAWPCSLAWPHVEVMSGRETSCRGMCSNQGFHSTEIYLGMHWRFWDKEELLLHWSCAWGEGKAGSGRGPGFCLPVGVKGILLPK